MLPQPTDGFAWAQAPAGPALVCRALQPLADHVFTTRRWTLGSAAVAIDADWQPVATALNVELAHLVRVHQVHGHAVFVRRAGDRPSRPDADVIVSADSSAALAIQTADCVPLLIADARTGAVAAAHAGWRGLAARVPSAAVEALTREFGSRPGDLVAAVGPSIRACCYEVGADVVDAFARAGFADAAIAGWFTTSPQPSSRNPSMPGLPRPPRSNHWYFDGSTAVRHQLEAAGVPARRIHVAELCTASHPEVLCSYRRDGNGAGRMAGAIRPRTSNRKSHN
ncbi:MAG: peptidoglycan editing factor PgeF [Acidobacteria bacterium]|nr:peptidoglycan editing factor PgeF [Acidobacteriota bacterium]